MFYEFMLLSIEAYFFLMGHFVFIRKEEISFSAVMLTTESDSLNRPDQAKS